MIVAEEYTELESRNRAIVLDYYDKLIGQWDFDAASAHLGDRFVQHNPEIPDGIDGLRNWIGGVPDMVRANLKSDIRRVIVDGDMVVVHSITTMAGIPDVPPRAIADFFRLEDGKVVEHWDVIQTVPATALHENSMV